MLDEKTVMLREIAMQPDFVRNNIDEMFARAQEALKARRLDAVTSGFTIGCGDSFCAALAARYYMMETTQRWFEPVEAWEFSQYLVASLTPRSMVIGVSNSGSVTATIEGVRLARACGASTFALTVGTENELAKTAETVIEVNAVPNIKTQSDGSRLVTPGTITYCASLLGLYVAAIALAQRVGTLSVAASVAAVGELRRLADRMTEADLLAGDVRELARSFRPGRTTVILGGGPNFATAYYGMAKFLEALQWPTHHAQVEEWAHEHYFITGRDTDTIVIAPPGPACKRGLEQARAAREMGSRTIVLGAQSDRSARAAADVFIGLPDDIPELLTPFVYKLPFEYLACYLAQLHATSFFNFNDPLRQQVNFRQIFDTARVVPPPASAQ